MDNTETANIRLLQNAKEIMDFDASELDVYARLTEAQLLKQRPSGERTVYCGKSESDYPGIGWRI